MEHEAALIRLGGLTLHKETLISLAGLAILWEGASWLLPDFIAPGWERIFVELLMLSSDHLMVTVGRVVVALAVSFVVGTGLAIIMYLSKRIEDYLSSLVRLLMAVPVICWILFTVLWFRNVEFRTFFILLIVCGTVFITDILDAIKGVPRELREMVASFRPSRFQYMMKLLIPAVVPAILTSWKINLSLAIRVVTIAELVGATSGIGYLLYIAQSNFSVAQTFALTIVLVAILFAFQAIISLVESRLLKWRI